MAKCAHCDGTGLVGNGAACAVCSGTGRERATKVDEGIKALRKKVGRTKASGDQFTDGAVIRWTFSGYVGPARRRYCFAALRAGGRWWITGSGVTYGGKASYTYDELAKILAREDTTDVTVASAWSVL